MINNNKMEYIASGTSYTRCTNPDNLVGEKRDFIDSMFAEVSKNTEHHFGLLYNAFSESGFGKKLREYKNIHSLHADSGGLQMVTMNKTITEELKDKIYKNQGTWADISMSFDEIPVQVSGSNANKNDFSNRWYDGDNLEDYARLTGRNLKKQIETFDKMGSDSKPLFVTQGNDYDSYMRWTEYALDEIPKEMHERIGGVAMGAAALGHGTLEDIERAFYYKEIPFDSNHLHILGLGSTRRMMPTLVFMQNGYYSDQHISYDSTTQTCGAEVGTYINPLGKTMSFSRVLNKQYEEIYTDIASMFNLRDIVDLGGFHEVMNSGVTKYREEHKGDDFVYLKVRFYFLIKNIINYCKYVDGMLADKSMLLDLAYRKKMFNPINALYDVKNKADFDHWVKQCGSYVKSDRVNSSKPITLDSFFV